MCYDLAHQIEESNVSTLEVDRAVLPLDGYSSLVQPCEHYNMLANNSGIANSFCYQVPLVHIADISDPVNDGHIVQRAKTRSNHHHTLLSHQTPIGPEQTPREVSTAFQGNGLGPHPFLPWTHSPQTIYFY